MSSATERTCNKCRTTKPINDFYSYMRGNTKWCKECLRELSRQRVKDGRDNASKIKSEELKGHLRKPKLTVLQIYAGELYRNMKKRALYTNKEMNISREEIESLIEKFCASNHFIIDHKSPFRPSVDRLDNTKGYTLDNIRICWLIENYCKNIFTDEQVIEFCKRKLGITI